VLRSERTGRDAAERKGAVVEPSRERKELLHVASIKCEMQELLTTY
jgi:hypothetical protein